MLETIRENYEWLAKEVRTLKRKYKSAKGVKRKRLDRQLKELAGRTNVLHRQCIRALD